MDKAYLIQQLNELAKSLNLSISVDVIAKAAGA